MNRGDASWNAEAVIAELVRRSRATPYRVDLTARGVTVGFNIADLRYVTLWYRRGLTLAYAVEVVLDEAGCRYYRLQSSQQLRYAMGTDGQVLGVTLERSRVGGTVREMQGGIVGGLHDDGDIGKGYAFDSREITHFVDSVMAESGWRRRMDPQTRWGMVGAIIGGTVALLAGVLASVIAFSGV